VVFQNDSNKLHAEDEQQKRISSGPGHGNVLGFWVIGQLIPNLGTKWEKVLFYTSPHFTFGEHFFCTFK
jgi:hypothetical protein